ncbi:MAG: hemerythrin domain-containing protein [Pseudomonadota bacterium]
MQAFHPFRDLRGQDPVAVRSQAFALARDLHPGQTAGLLVAEEPTLLMQSVNLQVRHRLHWEAEPMAAGGWRVELRHRDDVEPGTLMELLGRDHERLDRLFAEALHRVNANDVPTAAPLLGSYTLGLRRHVHVENLILAPAFEVPREPVTVMLEEHERIVEQLDILASFFEDGLPAAGEVAPFFALLSGSLAKHEAREEQNLFPLWDAALKRRHAEAEQAALLERVKGILAGSEDDRLSH